MAATTSIPANGKFSLPTLSPLPSLTTGTNIPPPPPSPPPPAPVVPVQKAAEKATPIDKGDGAAKGPTSPTSPASPTTAGRPGSLRRLLSINSLNGREDSPGHGRRSSIASTSSPGTSSAKGRRLWFRKKAVTNSIDEGAEHRKKGPPPPTLPELKLEGAEQGMDSSKMFGDIK